MRLKTVVFKNARSSLFAIRYCLSGVVHLFVFFCRYGEIVKDVEAGSRKIICLEVMRKLHKQSKRYFFLL